MGPLARSIIDGVKLEHPEVPDVEGVIVAGIDVAPAAKTTLIFLDRSGRPAIVAKVARDTTSEPDLEGEYEALRRVRRRGAIPVCRQIPDPLDLARFDGRLALITSGLDGEPMMTRYYTDGHTDDPQKVAADFRVAFSWLTDLQTQTSADRISLADAASGWADHILERYYREIGCSAEEETLFAEAASRARSLVDIQVPVCTSHGDYWMGNLLLNGDRIAGVIDWERSEDTGFPFSDLYKFPTSYGFYLDRVSHRAGHRRSAHPGRESLRTRWARYGDWPNLIGFAYSYFGRGWFPDLVRASVLHHLERLGIPPAANWAFFPLFLAEQALAIPDESFRAGYRSAILALSAERDSTWLWQENDPLPRRALSAAELGTSDARVSSRGSRG